MLCYCGSICPMLVYMANISWSCSALGLGYFCPVISKTSSNAGVVLSYVRFVLFSALIYTCPVTRSTAKSCTVITRLVTSDLL